MSARCTLNGKAVLRGKLHLPLWGVWHADLEVDTATPLDVGGLATLAFEDGLQLKGTARRAGVTRDYTLLRLVGGRGGLRKPCDPRGYGTVPLQTVLQDVLQQAGEVLSAASGASALQTPLARWQTSNASCGAQVANLAERAGCAWRILTDGDVWFGQDTWPQVAPAVDVLREDLHLGRLELAEDTAQLVPGSTYAGRQIGYVTHIIEAGRLRAHVWEAPA